MGPLPNLPSVGESSMPSYLPIQEVEKDSVQNLLDRLGDKVVTYSCDSLSEYVHQLHDDTDEAITASLSRVNRLFERIFPGSKPLNPIFQPSDCLVVSEDLEHAFEKANQLYQAYKKECIEEALLKMPSYFYEHCKLDEKDFSMLQKVFLNVGEEYKREILEPEFDMLNDLCALRVIHYALGIPPSAPKSETRFIWLHPGSSYSQGNKIS